jgi:N-acetylmuramic acid 6-phosphate etherase
MKAGTAQRIALLLLSSLVMILLGRVYEGLMVDVQALNQKLVRRSEKILARLSGRSGEEIEEALSRAGGSVKLAFLLLQGCSRSEAETALERAGGHLRRAMGMVGGQSANDPRQASVPCSRER